MDDDHDFGGQEFDGQEFDEEAFDDQDFDEAAFGLGDDAPDSPIANEAGFVPAFEANPEQAHINGNIRDQIISREAFFKIASLFPDDVPEPPTTNENHFAEAFETLLEAQQAEQAQEQEVEEVEPNPSDLPPRMARQRPSNGDGNDLVVDRGVKKKAHRRQDPFADMSAVEFLQANQDYIVHPNDAFDDEGDEGGDDDDIERDCEWTKKRDRFSLPPPASPPPPVVQPRRPAEESYGPQQPAAESYGPQQPAEETYRPQQPAEETYQPATPGETNVPTNDLRHRTLLASSTLDEHPTRKRKLSDTATGEAEPAISRRRSSALPPGTSTGPPQPSSLPSNLNIGSSPQFSPVPEHLILRSSSRETPYNLRTRRPNVPDHLILRSSTPISPRHQSHDPEQTVR